MEIYKNTIDLFLDGEIWKDIKGYDGDYQVSNLGRVKSFKQNKVNGKILNLYISNWGYLFIDLCENRKQERYLIHILLYEIFSDYKLKKNEIIHHKDKNKLNNDLNNLIKMTILEHKSLHMSGKNNHMYNIHLYGKDNPFFGKHHSNEWKKKHSEIMKQKNNEQNHPMYGKHHSEKTKKLIRENSPTTKLTENNIVKIWKYLDEGILTQKEIAKLFGVDPSTISKIKNGKIWQKD